MVRGGIDIIERNFSHVDFMSRGTAVCLGWIHKGIAKKTEHEDISPTTEKQQKQTDNLG